MASAARADPCPLSITGQRTGRKKGGNMDQYASIPAELKSMDQWVGFVLDYNEEKGKNDKLPIDPHKLTNAKANDPGTWGMYQSAFDCIGKKASYWVQRKSGWQKHEKTIDGIGFEFAGGIFGVDLDHVITQDGIDPAAQDIIETLDSYTEYSPSGTGVHILCKGTIPPGERKAGSAEMYSQGRFFTVTGKAFGPVKPLAERTAQAAAVHAKYFKKADPPAAQQAAPLPVFTLSQSDDEVLQRAFNSRNGDRIRALYAGDITAHNGADRSHSAADLALCSELAYWTNGDAAQIDRMFRRSALWRDKWDEKRGAKTYGEATIAAALKDFQPYIPRSTAEQDFAPVGSDGPPAGGLEADLRTDAEKLEAAAAYQRESVEGFIDSFFNGVSDSVNTPAIPTGFNGLDKLLEGGLYEGLYIVGAISSLGKTTFVLQMADQIAAAGQDVIIFSLEMARSELIAKSISRLTYKRAQRKADAKTTRGITTGKRYAMYSDTEISIIEAAREEYRKISGRLWIREGVGNIGAEQVRAEIKRHIAITGRVPVIVIDYLQILAPYDMRATDKQNTDKTVLELKRISRDYKLPVIGISSFNRDNYLAPVNMAAFKESGAIEYSSDVLIGLQYQGMDYQEGEADGARQKRIRKLNKDNDIAAREGRGIEIELKVLKARNGGRGTSDPLTFYPMFNCFIEHPEGFTVIDDEPRRRRP